MLSSLKQVEVFFDGACPLCRREVALLRRLDRNDRIQFTDLSAPGFDPSALGLTMADLMAELHGRLPDGTLIRGMEVFRNLYSQVGWGGLVKWTGWPGFRPLCDAAYRAFAKRRLRLTGRCDDRAGSCRVGQP